MTSASTYSETEESRPETIGPQRRATINNHLEALRSLQAIEPPDLAEKSLFHGRKEERDNVDVLLSQRDMMEARMVLIETKQQQLSAIINTYQALGGGGVLPGFDAMPMEASAPSPFRRMINFFCF